MPINIVNKKLCSGCAACFNICPKNCISMKPDSCGFVYPFVDKAICINCELCQHICPIINKERLKAGKPLSVNVAWSKNAELRYNSTSGGMFSEIAYQIIIQGGSVVGAAYGKDNMVVHQIVKDAAGIEKLRQSKYVQSSIDNIYKIIKNLLENQIVLFCGAPCQVAGLKSFLGSRYTNLITMDFICHGVNSPKAYRAWLEESESRQKAKVIRVQFRYKEDGWKKSALCTRLDFSNGDIVIQRGIENAFMCGYLSSNLFVRPSCSECKFKGRNRYSDITVGDFWGVDSSLDDDKGTSFVQVNTTEGLALINAIHQNIFIYEDLGDNIGKGNPCMDYSVEIDPRSEEFLKKIGKEKSFSWLVDKYINNTLKKRMKSFIKRRILQRFC